MPVSEEAKLAAAVARVEQAITVAIANNSLPINAATGLKIDLRTFIDRVFEGHTDAALARIANTPSTAAVTQISCDVTAQDADLLQHLNALLTYGAAYDPTLLMRAEQLLAGSPSS
jgi:hypothetical protein